MKKQTCLKKKGLSSSSPVVHQLSFSPVHGIKKQEISYVCVRPTDSKTGSTTVLVGVGGLAERTGTHLIYADVMLGSGRNAEGGTVGVATL